MAGLRMLNRRIRRAFSSKAVQLSSICVLLFLSIQWVILHNHETSSASPIRPRPTARIDSKNIDWSRFKYVQYVTTERNLCSSLMIWDEIEEIGSRAQRLMLYPSDWDVEEKINGEFTPIARMLQQAQKNYYVKIRPLDALVVQNKSAGSIWMDPYTKFLGFNLTEFDRVLVIDSDSVVRQNLDELFLIPGAPVAMPYVYWGKIDGWQFSTQLMIMTPSATSFSRISDAIKGAKITEYDTSILETLFHGEIIKIPQRPFALLSGEYRRSSHAIYMGNRFPKEWDPDYVKGEARIIHFSDHPLPKPWTKASQDLLNRNMPKCKRSEWFGASDCRDRATWMKLYWDYDEKRKAVCGAGFGAVVHDGPAEVEVGMGRRRVFDID